MALLQTAFPALRLEYRIIRTRGDQALDTPLPLVGGKGVFTAELETALHEGDIDFAVHSLKDLPTAQPPGLVIGAVLARANPADVLICRQGHTLDSLPPGAVIGTSSYRRAAQLLHRRPDLHMRDIRGNVDTRIRKALTDPGDDSGYDAIVLAYAGVERLGLLEKITQVLDLETMLPAPGQGAIAVQTRHDPALLQWLAPVHHAETALAVAAERAFLARIGGGCSVPVAAYARWDGGRLHLRGRVTAPNGSAQIELAATADVQGESAAQALGEGLAQAVLDRGAQRLIEGQA